VPPGAKFEPWETENHVMSSEISQEAVSIEGGNYFPVKKTQGSFEESAIIMDLVSSLAKLGLGQGGSSQGRTGARAGKVLQFCTQILLNFHFRAVMVVGGIVIKVTHPCKQHT